MSGEESKMANPVGEDNWVAFLDEARRNASDLEQYVVTLELFKTAAAAEPGSLKIWLAYCEYFHALYTDALTPNPSWSQDEVAAGRDIFTLDSTLQQWQEGYEAVRYRLGDSHVLWNRWMELEMEQLVRTRTPEGIKRISHLYRDRLQTPHLGWDETSQSFSSFLSEHNRNEWEETMKEVTALAQDAKRLVAARERFEFPLQKAERSGNAEAQRTTMKEYLVWEVMQSKRNNDKPEIAHDLCRGLFSRALTGVFSTDDSVWLDYVVYLSSWHSPSRRAESLLGVLQVAVEHCPSAGSLWSRYILSAEEARLPFTEVELIKHAATNNQQLYKDGMASLLDMYVAWCGFLRRSAMQPNATDEAVDIADVGLPTALEDVEVLGKRLYGKDYKGDPDFRLEKIYIQYLSSKPESVEEARGLWNVLASKPLYADRYDFWRAYHLWEMSMFTTLNRTSRSPTPSSTSGAATPTRATAVLSRAINRKTLDWPERAIDVYVQHCNDFEPPTVLRHALDDVHRIRNLVARRREREAAEAAAAAYAYQAQMQGAAVAPAPAPAPAQGAPSDGAPAVADSPSGSKRKREASPTGAAESTSKRPKKDADQANQAKESESQDAMHRDRENTTVLVTGLPGDVTHTAIKKYFKEFGHINDMKVQQDDDGETATALVEFASPQEARDVVAFRDNKFFGQCQIGVKSGARLTLFVTNYPPAADERYIRDLFKECGHIVAVRFPSLKFNTRRRFCYISFSDLAAAAKATELDGKVLEGRYRVEVKYSDPSHKKRREGAVSEGRELHISNLNGGADEAELRDVFSKYGTITGVRMKGSRNPGKGSCSAFMDFATKEEAERAIAELNNTKLGSRIIRVEHSEQRTKVSAKMTNATGAGSLSGAPSPASTRDAQGDETMEDQKSGDPTLEDQKPEAEGAHVHDSKPNDGRGPPSARKMAILGLPDTVNDARVMALVEPIGQVVQLTVKPMDGTASVEFADEASAGRAMLQLDGHDLDGAKLQTGTMADLHRHNAASREQHPGGAQQKPSKDGKRPGKSAALLAPPMIRRPVLGRGGAKRGLGFVPRKPAGDKKKGGEGGAETNGPATQKSNADFKALFLGGKTEQQPDSTKD